MNEFVRWVKWGTGCLALLVLAGCGGQDFELTPVKGKVLCQDKPVPGGRVTLTPISESGGEMPAPPAYGEIDENGNFELYTDGSPGAAVGKHQVSVILPEPGDVQDLESDLKQLEAEGDDPADVEEKKAELEVARRMAKIPCRRPDVPEVTIKAGEANTLEIELVIDDD